MPLGSADPWPRGDKPSEGTLDSSKKPTPSKKDEIRKDVETELSVEELEERIAPATKKFIKPA